MIYKKGILAIIIISIAGTLVFWKRDYFKQKLGLNEPDADANGTTNTTSNPLPPNKPKLVYRECKIFPMKLGCKGPKIRGLQFALNRYHNATLQVDGYFGPATESALEKAGFGKTLEVPEVAKLIKK